MLPELINKAGVYCCGQPPLGNDWERMRFEGIRQRGEVWLRLESERLNFQLPFFQSAWLLPPLPECLRLVTVSVLNY